MASLVISADALRSIGFGSIGASYLPIGTAFSHAMRIIKVINTTDAGMIISYDGTTDNDYVPAGGFFLYDVTTNQVSNTSGWFFRNGTQVYVKYATAPSSGSVFLSAFYARGD